MCVWRQKKHIYTFRLHMCFQHFDVLRIIWMSPKHYKPGVGNSFGFAGHIRD